MRRFKGPAIPHVNPIARMFDNRVARVDDRRQLDPVYLAEQYGIWRKAVMARAGWRCQADDDGLRCKKSAPDHRMYADHVKELKDGGAPFDPRNGQCLCGSHHTVKTVLARAKRLAARP